MGDVSTDRVLTGPLTIENPAMAPGTCGIMSRETGQAIFVDIRGPEHAETAELWHAGDSVSFPLNWVQGIVVRAGTSYPAHVLINYTNAPLSLTAAPFLAGGDPANPVPVTVV